jgi:predicted nucleic acid-binding protein
MTYLVDTSVWLALDKDATGALGLLLERQISGKTVSMLPPIRMELLQGCRGPSGWSAMVSRLDAFSPVAMTPAMWTDAARIYFDARQSGQTIRSSFDCLIAQACLYNGLTLIHNDRDFDAIATIRPLKHIRLDLTKA